MYVRPISTRLLRGMLIPEIRAISTLPLLVARIRADHEDPPVSADDLALLTHRLDRRSYFHVSSLSGSIAIVATARLWRPLRSPLPCCSSASRALNKGAAGAATDVSRGRTDGARTDLGPR